MISRSTTPTEHWIFLFWFVFRPAEQGSVLVGFEIREPHNHIIWPKSGPDLTNTFSQFVDIKSNFVFISQSKGVDFVFKGNRLYIFEVQKSIWVYPNTRGNNKLFTSQAHPFVWNKRVHKSTFRRTNIHTNFCSRFWQVGNIVHRFLPF